jgi:hypothetical protein
MSIQQRPTDCIDTAPHGMKPSGGDPSLDPPRPESEFQQLSSRDHAVLSSHQSPDLRIPPDSGRQLVI